MKSSIFDVAKKSGLSVVTVSRVINNAGTVRESNRQKVLQAMRELDYHPSAAARSLARGKTGVIGLTMTTLHDSFLDAVVKEINVRLMNKGYFLAISVASDEESSFHRSMFQEDRVDGMILLSPVQEDGYAAELQRKGIPFVLLDNQRTHPGVPSVLVDNYRGAYDAARHLLELGHTDIAHIRGPELFLSSRERERGFAAALRDAGITSYAAEQGSFDISSGYRIASRWLAEGKLPTAVFAADDFMALGVANALHRQGLRIPDDMSIVGFDDQIYASEFRPALTTVRQPAEEIARRGVELLLQRVEGAEPAADSAPVLLRPELIVRESTGWRRS